MNFAEIDLAWVLINAVVLLFSLSVHESAHAWTANRLGDPTGRDLGRITLNPLPHIDPIGTIVFPLIGLLAGGFIFGWAKPVPVNWGNLRDPKLSNAVIAGAGPLSNVLAAVGFALGLRMVMMLQGGQHLGSVSEPLLILCQSGLIINLILAISNLIPVPPLDGSWILGGILPDSLARGLDTLRPYGFLILLLLLYSGVIGRVLYPVLSFVRSWIL